ncbi:hemagglutinin [Protaetiibacter larvae]|uniref:Hemagglutinin n=1 Tax=Protaetiibacter larvae TaxID=2592654 RepID=A0A5C1Y8J6_9MICO|nr:hemagglutinin [Protaetiibacter larvae]QEO09489.1 hemagglutinin [Protaetiibacter larvae]
MQPVNDPQIWTLIGVFAAVMLGGMTLMTTLLMRSTTSAIDGLRDEMNARFEAVHREMNARFDTVEVRIDHLDRDVSAITRKVWGESPER